MAKFGTYKNDPRQINAKYDCVCKETGKPIKKFDPCIYYPAEKGIYHMESNTAKNFWSESFDMEYLGANY